MIDRADIMERLETMLDNPVHVIPAHDLPAPSIDQVDEFTAIVRGLADMIFPPDAYGDSVIDVNISNSRLSKMVVHCRPNEPEGIYGGDIATSTALQYIDDLSQYGSMLATEAKSAIDRVAFLANHVKTWQGKREAMQEAVDRIRFLIDSGQIDGVRKELPPILDRYDTQKPDGSRPTNRRQLPDSIYDLIERFGEMLPMSEITPRLAELDAAIDEIKETVGQDFPTRSRSVQQLIWKHEFEVGANMIRPAIQRFNQLSKLDTAIRYLAKQVK